MAHGYNAAETTLRVEISDLGIVFLINDYD